MTDSPIAAFHDSNVLYPFLMRDILLQTYEDELCTAKWSPDVRAELLRTYQRNHPDKPHDRFETYTLRKMDELLSHDIVTGYQALAANLMLPDPDDRHVLAAAIHGDCDMLVTQNLKDFPVELCARYGIDVLHPDQFLLQLLQREPIAFVASVRTCRAHLKRPPMSVSEYLESLTRAGLPSTVAALRFYARRLA